MKRDSNLEAGMAGGDGESGSVMLWSLMILTLLLVLVTAWMTMAASSLTKVKRDTAKSQVYYTSKGMADVAAAAVFGDGNVLLRQIEEAVIQGEDFASCGELPQDWDLVEGLPKQMGECRLRIFYEAETEILSISARTEMGDLAQVITLQYNKENLDPNSDEDESKEEEKPEGITWIPKRYIEEQIQ